MDLLTAKTVVLAVSNWCRISRPIAGLGPGIEKDMLEQRSNRCFKTA